MNAQLVQKYGLLIYKFCWGELGRWYAKLVQKYGLLIYKFCWGELGRWYAKRFMHPDIVEQYNYIFLWDEDLGVENFNASR